MTQGTAVRIGTGAVVRVEWRWQGTVEYERGLALQQGRVHALLEGSDEQVVYSLEHPPTITIGKSGTRDHIVAPSERLRSMGISVYEVDRGGDVTYHGPGQLVVYPILHLGPWGNDVGRYVRMLEETVIQALAGVGLRGHRVEGYPGVWVGEEKVCAVGARVKRRPDGEFVTSHGFALNVCTNLAHFETIIPCGIADKGVTSVERLIGAPASVPEWEARIRSAFAQVFGVALEGASRER